jgi:hypothetical protein
VPFEHFPLLQLPAGIPLSLWHMDIFEKHIHGELDRLHIAVIKQKEYRSLDAQCLAYSVIDSTLATKGTRCRKSNDLYECVCPLQYQRTAEGATIGGGVY